jgi:hypothetical protein
VANFPSTFEALGRRWLVTGRGNGGFVVRPWDDATRGFVAVPLGQDAFSAMTVARDANRVVGFWSPNAGETIVQAKTIDLTAPMQDLTGVVLPFVPRLNHNVSIAPFKDPANETGADSEIVVNGAAPTSDRPHWTAKDDASLAYFRRDIDHGLYTEASTTAEMLAAITLAEDLDTRLLWCHDGTDLDLQLVKLLRPCDVVLLECYRSTAETLAQSKARWSDNLSALLSACGNLVGLIAQDYDMGGVGPAELWSVQDTLDACEAIAEMVNTSVRIILIAPFEIQRANGADAHPDLLAIVKRWVAATPGVAELRPVNAAPTPTPRPPGPKPTPKPQPTPVLRFLAPARAFGSKAA